MIYAAWMVGEHWVPGSLGWVLPFDWDIEHEDAILITQPIAPTEEGNPVVRGVPLALCPSLVKSLVEEKGEKDALRSMVHDITMEVAAVLNLCEVLTCSNVTTAIHQRVDERVNRRRVRKGKIPFYETKVLVLEDPKQPNERTGITVNDRNSPRQHLRRGHIRRLEDDKKIWVNACVVGKKEDGVLSKSYVVGED